MPDKKLTDAEIVKALERLKNTKDYLKEKYQKEVKKCPYPELKPIVKQTYEDNKKAFDIAIKAIEEFNRLQAENERVETLNSDLVEIQDIRKKVNLALIAENAELTTAYKTAKSEAYKEFAEMIDKTTWYHINKNGELVQGANSETDIPLYKAKDVHNLLKEMVGEDE